MTDLARIRMLKTMTDEVDEEILSTYLLLAKGKILNLLYPFEEYTMSTDIPMKYEMVWLEIAAYMINKRGAEGEITHTEGGVSRTYMNGDIPSELARKIIPMCKVIGDSNEIDE